ncbi:Uma2 family endonuclease [Herbidospora galbida]|uniref:Uma2 family endonuclease n=1 Tax=Herbidospora galbida TaxID=2575442 RepID=A0A4U3MAN1_9ACTN|nr:Uma2 family endonuclease [Herbidospora galbida]
MSLLPRDLRWRAFYPETVPDDWFRTLSSQPHPLTAEEYALLPGDLLIEVVDGYVVHRPSNGRRHQTVARRLADLLEKHAREAMARGYGCLTVANAADVRLRDVPLHVRRPDVVLFRCLDDDHVLRPDDVVLAVEIVEPGTETTDTCGKPSEYGRAGILYYWILRLDRTGVSAVERYHLDQATMTYKHIGTLMRDAGGSPEIGMPIPMIIDWPELQD